MDRIHKRPEANERDLFQGLNECQGYRLNFVPQTKVCWGKKKKRCVEFPIPVSQNMTLFRNKLWEMQLVKMRSHWSEVGP